MAQQPLTQFWPIFPLKSDGQDVVNQKGTPLRNGPTQEQLDRTPNEQGQSDYYRLLDKDEPKHIDWRKKLGGMLLREIGAKAHEEKWQQCILYDFPEGYRLYEHIKSKANGESKAAKNHSGGGHDRQDAYLYGYPKGPRKRFRSPVDFFPHLLWLSTDETSDYQNCTCRICSPNQIEVEKPAPPPAASPLSTTSFRGSTTPLPIRRPSTGPTTIQSPLSNPQAPVPAPSAPQIKPPPRLEPTPLPQPRSLDQQIDGQYAKFMARVGEVVWFLRKGPSEAYGLGLVVRRWMTKAGSVDRTYLIQPLSYPTATPAQELVETDQKVKPWLAWSCPGFTFPYLQQNPTLRYEQVDWNMLFSGEGGQGIPEVDASILSAKAVDLTYTLFERLKTISNNGGEERQWNGVFYGAEKIWRGEPVRLRIGPGTDILVISEITEKVYPRPPGQATTNSVKVELRGDIYSYATVPAPNPNALPDVPMYNHIPIRMREDMQWRNNILVPSTLTLAYWKLAATNARIDLEDVKGRWYETSLLFEGLFKTSVKNKEGGNGMWMNSRGDATGMGREPGIQHTSRLLAFGNAVPKGTQLTDGLDPPSHHPKPEVQAGLELNIATPAADIGFLDVDDFMNFDAADDANMATFSENFHY